MLGRPHGGLGSVGSLGFPEDSLDVHLHRSLSQPKIPCDELVRGSLGQEPQDLSLAIRELGWKGTVKLTRG